RRPRRAGPADGGSRGRGGPRGAIPRGGNDGGNRWAPPWEWAPWERVAAVAPAEPQIAAKPPQAAMVAMPSPPLRWPRKAFAARNSSRLMPEVVANAPISRNSGTTAKL